jgi:5,10-methylenetetrahydromethanopterin reductase
MRLGVMIGAERGDMARKVSKLVADIEWADSAGLSTAWMPQVPDDFDLLTMAALMASHSTRIELGTAVVPLQAQHPIALARQALSVHAVSNGRLALGVGPSHHWIIRDMLGLPYDKPAAYTRDYLEVLNAAISGPGGSPAGRSEATPGTRMIDVENDTFTVHNPTVLGAETKMPVLVAALGPVMLQIAGEHADGTTLWMADEKAIGEHIAPKINKAAADAGKPAPRIVAGIPVTLCANSEIGAAKERANRILAEAETSPNYQRLLDRGAARDVGDLCAAGDEESILKRFKAFADAGVTDLSVRLLPIGETRDELIASKYRTREVIAELAKAVQ